MVNRIYENNEGSRCKYQIDCINGSSATYILDGKYKTLKGQLSLRSEGLENENEDEEDEIWLQFYSADENGRIADLGTSEKFRVGVRPKTIDINVEGVKELEIVGCYKLEGDLLLTDGLFLE